MPNEEQFLEWTFPLSGIDRQEEFQEQPALTTPVAKNVRAFEPSSDRGRGGSRPGISKYLADQLPSGSNVIQHLKLIVDPQGPLLGLSFDPDTDGDPFVDTSDGGRNLLDDGSTRLIREGGSGFYTHPEATQNLPGAIALVQSKQVFQASAPGAVTLTFDSVPVVNNLLLVFVVTESNATPVVTVATDAGSFTQAGSYTFVDASGIDVRLSLWYRVAGAVVSDEQTVTVTPDSGTPTVALVGLEYEKTLASSVLDDVQDNADEGFPVTMTTGPIAVNSTGEVVVAAFASTNAIDTVTPGNGFTLVEQRTGSDIQLYVVHKLDNSTAQEPTADWDGGGQEYCAIGGSFKWSGGA